MKKSSFKLKIHMKKIISNNIKWKKIYKYLFRLLFIPSENLCHLCTILINKINLYSKKELFYHY